MRTKLSTTLIQLIEETISDPEDGAEIGVFKAETSMGLINHFPKLYMNLVDPWTWWPEGASYRKHKRTGNYSQEKWNSIYQAALKNIGDEKRAIVCKMTSEEASLLVRDNLLDFVFLDGSHVIEDITLDLKLWGPKIRKGGLFCGHDYGGRYRGVMKAVNKAYGRENLILPGNRVWGIVL